MIKIEHVLIPKSRMLSLSITGSSLKDVPVLDLLCAEFRNKRDAVAGFESSLSLHITLRSIEPDVIERYLETTNARKI